LLPRYTELYTEGMSELSRGLIIGTLMSSFSAMQFLFAPLWGRISDRIGRRPVLLLGLAGSVIFYGLFGYASTYEKDQATMGLILMYVSRLGAGLAGATISTAAAVVADNTTRENRAKGMALIGAAFGLGFTIGPLLAYAGSKLFPDARSGPGYLAATLSLIALFLAWRLMPETNRGQAEARSRDLWRLHGLVSVVREHGVGLLVVSFFMAVFAFANFEGTLSLLTQSAFAYGDDANYLIFAFVGASLMIAQGVIYRRIIKRFGELLLARAGLLMMLIGLASLALVAWYVEPTTPRWLSLTWLLLTLFVAVSGFAFLNPSLNALISRRSDPTRQGEILGVNQSASALARILGPAVGNVLFRQTTQHERPYLVAAAMLLVVLGLSMKLRSSDDVVTAQSGEPIP
jgi:DHA1 family tetracycline resistance protein-like MFS transporter